MASFAKAEEEREKFRWGGERPRSGVRDPRNGGNAAGRAQAPSRTEVLQDNDKGAERLAYHEGRQSEKGLAGKDRRLANEPAVNENKRAENGALHDNDKGAESPFYQEGRRSEKGLSGKDHRLEHEPAVNDNKRAENGVALHEDKRSEKGLAFKDDKGKSTTMTTTATTTKGETRGKTAEPTTVQMGLPSGTTLTSAPPPRDEKTEASPAPLQALRVEADGPNIGQLSIDWEVVGDIEKGLNEHGGLGGYLQHLATKERRSAYRIGSEFAPNAAAEGWSVQSPREREMFKEVLEGVRIPWAAGAKRKLFGRDHKQRLQREMARQTPARTAEAELAFSKAVVNDMRRGYLLVVSDECAKGIKNMKVSPTFMVEQKDKFRRINDYTEKRHGRADPHSINSNTNAERDAEPDFGKTKMKIFRQAWQIRRERPGEPIVIYKIDEDSAFLRIHVHPEDCAAFSYRVAPGLIGVPLRLQMGWKRSPALQSVVSASIARTISATSAKDVREEGYLHAKGFEPRVNDERPITETTTDETAQPDPSRPFDPEAGAPTGAYIDDLISLTLGIASLMSAYAAGVNEIFHRFFRRLERHEEAFRDEVISVKKLLADGFWSTTHVVLGTMLDTTLQEVSVPPEKAEALLRILAGMEGSACDFDDLRSLIGKLQDASLGVWAGPYYLRRLFDALIGLDVGGENGNRVSLTPEVHEELQFWVQALTEQVPVPLSHFIHRHATWRGASDACGSGMGGYWRLKIGNEWRDYCWSVPFDDELKAQFVSATNPGGTFTINTAELLAILINFEVLVLILQGEGMEHLVRGSLALCMCDNSASVSWVERKSSKGEKESILLRALGDFVREWRIEPVAFWVAGEDNVFADFMSRYQIEGGKKFGGVASVHEACDWLKANVEGVTNPIPFLFTPQVTSTTRLKERLTLLQRPYSRTIATRRSATTIGLESGAAGVDIVRRTR